MWSELPHWIQPQELITRLSTTAICVRDSQTTQLMVTQTTSFLSESTRVIGNKMMELTSSTAQSLYPYLVHFMRTVVDGDQLTNNTNNTNNNSNSNNNDNNKEKKKKLSKKSHKVSVRRENNRGQIIDEVIVDVNDNSHNNNAVYETEEVEVVNDDNNDVIDTADVEPIVVLHDSVHSTTSAPPLSSTTDVIAGDENI